jgi:hypothetical protein
VLATNGCLHGPVLEVLKAAPGVNRP